MLQPRVTTPRGTTGLELCRRSPSSAHPQPGSLKPGRATEIQPRPWQPPDGQGTEVFDETCVLSPFRLPLRSQGSKPGAAPGAGAVVWNQAVTALYGPDGFGIYRLGWSSLSVAKGAGAA